MEILRAKNVATVIAFPLISTANNPAYETGTVWGSLTSEAITAYFSDNNAAWSLLTITGTPTELGSTGEWSLAISQSQMNHDRILIKLNADEIDEQTILINTEPQTDLDSVSSFVVGNAVYDGTNLILAASLIIGNSIVASPTSCAAELYKNDDGLSDLSYTTGNFGAATGFGVFQASKTIALSANDDYTAVVTIVENSVPYFVALPITVEQL